MQSSPLSILSPSPDSSAPQQSQASPFSLAQRIFQTNTKLYRGGKLLPFELQERCRIFLEETLCGFIRVSEICLIFLDSQALSLLVSLVSSGGSRQDAGSIPPAWIPPPQYLALAATMAVHPSMTNRTHRTEKIQSSIEALQFLRLLQTSVGPYNSQFAVAYAFPSKLRLNRRGGVTRRDSQSPDKASHDAIGLAMAQSGSLWARAGDFWAIIGWALNCSIRHPKRWTIWLPFLEHILDVLNIDAIIRRNNGTLEASLMVQYLGEPQSRRIIRAVFADGRKQSMQEFAEIWKNETLEKKQKADASYEKVTVDFETEDFGNYFNVSDDSSSEDGAQTAFDGTNDEEGLSEEDNFIDALSNPTIADDAAELGGAASIRVRMRVLALLLQFAAEMPERFTDLESLVRLLNTYFRAFSLPLFMTVLSIERLASFAPPTASFMIQSLACTLLEASAPRPSGEDLDQKVLETCYLPWAANTTSVSDNAKLAACIEILLRLYEDKVGLKWTTKLELAVEQGSKRREGKIQKDSRKREGSSEDDHLAKLRSCHRRVMLLLRLAYQRTENATGKTE